MSQFNDVIAGRIRALDRDLDAARGTGACDDEARIESELSDLERLQRENTA